jgi:hypothetical protein
MTELKERFSLADEIVARDLWREARERAATPEASSRGHDWPPALRRRLTAATVALAVFAAAAAFAWDLSHPDRHRAPKPMHTVDLTAELPVGWSELTAPPDVRRGAATVWTGSQLLVWGGYVYEGGFGEGPLSHGGVVFDGASRRWEQMPTGPLSARSDSAVAWTGDEFLIWGGRTRDDCCAISDTNTFLGDGAAYDPIGRTWRRLPDAPIEARAPLSVWTGHELIVWGSTDRNRRYRNGAAYDPVSDTWRRIDEGPLDLTDAVALWSGEEMIVFGAALHGGNHPETETAIGAAYNPKTDSWRELPPSIATNPNANTAAWAGDRVIAVDYDNDAEMFRPGSGGWRTLDPMPLHEGEDVPRAAYLEGWVLVSFFGQVAAFSTEAQEWTDLTDELAVAAPGIVFPSAPIPAGGVALFFDAGSGDGPRLLAYRPPTLGEDPAPFVPNTTRDGNLERLPLVFPGGAETTLVYPSSLDLATLGVQPDASYLWSDDPAPRFPIVFLHDPAASISAYVDGGEPIATINNPHDPIEIWGMAPRWGSRRNLMQGTWLRFRLESWTVLVASKTVSAAYEVADYLKVRQTDEGFPVVDVVGPIELAEGFGEAGGPQLAFGDGTADPDAVSQLDALILFSPDGCTPATDSEFSGGYGSACLGDGNVFASIYGDRDFVTRLIEGLRVEDFRQT